MSEPESRLHMVQMSLDGPRLFELGRTQRIPLREADSGYLVHLALTNLFGAAAPKPFWIDSTGGSRLRLLGYSRCSMKALEAEASMYASPSVHQVCDWSKCASKPLPDIWPAGIRLGFETRVCPVKRVGKGSPVVAEGAEVDCFLIRCWRVGEDTAVDREGTYVEWLNEQFERHSGARLLSARMIGFQRERLTRRNHGPDRKSKLCERPDATMSGVLEVVDSSRFSDLLARGIGRHRSFGYGMLRLSRTEA